MTVNVKCSLCNAATTVVDKTPREAGWTLVQVQGAKGNKYIAACPNEKAADILARVKAAL